MSTPSPDKRPRLRDIVRGSIDDLQAAFDESIRTGGRTLVPAGRYRCLIAKGGLETAKTGTASYKLVLEILEGPHAGRKVFHDIWLTPKALRMSGHELQKIGFRSIQELDERPLPTGLIADVVVVVNTEDDGTQRNKVRSFRVVDADVPADDYSPDDPVTSEGDDEYLDGAGRASTPSKPSREPGEDDDLDADGFSWRTGEQVRHTSSAPLLDAARNGKRTT